MSELSVAAPLQIHTRDRFTQRLLVGSPRLLLAIAPAGYAKSAVVRSYAEMLPSYALCDCAEISGGIDLAQRVVAALARGDPARERALAEQRMADTANSATWNAFALDIWSKQNPHRLFIFENAEALADSVERVEFVGRLLARLPRNAQVAICARRPLPLSLSRYAAPHEIVTLRENTLKFNDSDIRAAFPDGVTEATLATIARLTRGWPIAVLLLARLAREGSLGSALEHLTEVDFGGLYDYLAEQVLDALRPEQFARLLAVAAIPAATAAEVALALDDPLAVDALARVAQTSAFIYAVKPNVYEAHPLIRAMLLQRHPARCREIVLRAAELSAREQPLRAAELFLHVGDEERSAAILERGHELFVSDLPALFGEIVNGLSESAIFGHLGLWAASAIVRSGGISPQQWLREALAARDRLRPDTPAAARIGVLTSFGNVLTNLGRHDEALAAFDAFAETGVELSQQYRAVQLLFRAAVAARRGHFGMALELWRTAEPAFAQIALTRAIGLEEVVARAALFTDSRRSERAALERSVAIAHESGAATVRALALQEAIFAAWFSGEDALAERYARELGDAVAPNTERGTEVLRAAMRGDTEPLLHADGIERPRFRYYAALIASTKAHPPERPTLLRIALDAAETAADATCTAIANVANAECFPKRRLYYTRRALAICANADATRLRTAVEAYADGAEDLGMLATLVKRYRSSRVERKIATHVPIAISIFSGTVRVNERVVPLSGRERELLFYLALHRRACSHVELAEALWPYRPASESALRVYAARVRARLDDAAAIESTEPGSYRISRDAHVDVHEAERVLELARSDHALSPYVRAQLETHAQAFAEGQPPVLTSWEWFAPFTSRIEDLRRQTMLLLGKDALRRECPDEARTLAARMIELDGCDESAWDLSIRAALLAGDTIAARRELRKYRDILAVELGAEPSRELERLVAGDASVDR